MNPTCPLCLSRAPLPLGRAHDRPCFECSQCRLAFVAPEHRPSPEVERARYETHENDLRDPGYRQFLDRVRLPLVERLPPGAEGLDYGAGPGPALSVMLDESGYPTAIYDPFFAPDAAPLQRTYDFITCTETIEHMFDPARELDQLDALLRPGGWLGIMTEVRDPDQPLDSWWYVRDPTHVCFYQSATLEWIARDRGWHLERPHRNVALYRKPPASSGS